jgi:xanthine permease XanP
MTGLNMSKKLSYLTYDVNSSPPLLATIVLGIQHMCLPFGWIVLPVLIIQQLGNNVSAGEAQSFISMTMIAGGIATLIQAYKMGSIGSGYFCPSLSGPAYFDASSAAAATGGLSLLFGMTLLSGAIESLFSRLMKKLRFLFPAEVTGLIVAMVGIVVLPISVKSFFGLHTNDNVINPPDVIVGVFTFSVMIALNVWSKGHIKLFCTLIGMTCGYILAVILNIIPQHDILRLTSASYFSLPQVSHIRWSFDFTLIIPFTVATICSSFKTVGDLVTCQKINDPEWKRPDMKNISDGILADGLGGVIPGLIGGYGQSTSSSNVGMSIATGAASRIIAVPMSILFIILAFFPKLSEIFIIMPKPVMGAVMIFSISFMITTGFQMMMSRMLDSRRIFVIGASLIFGLSVAMVPNLYSNVHPWIKPIFSSTLSLATICAIGLNLLFRIGISKRKNIIINPGDNVPDTIFSFMEQQGGAWGARKDVIYNATNSLTELVEAISSNRFSKGEINIQVSFDEFNLDAKIEYIGKQIILQKEQPTVPEILGDDGSLKLAAFIIYKYVDKIKIETKNDLVIINFHYEH